MCGVALAQEAASIPEPNATLQTLLLISSLLSLVPSLVLLICQAVYSILLSCSFHRELLSLLFTAAMVGRPLMLHESLDPAEGGACHQVPSLRTEQSF